MFICIPKINFIIQFFLEILHSKESCNLIGWQHFGPKHKNLENFARCGIGAEITIAILVFILNYFKEKRKTKFSTKSKKTLFWGHLGPLLPKFGQKWIFLGKRPWQFLIFQSSTIVPKIKKKLRSHSWENTKLTDAHTNRQSETDRQQWFYRTPHRTRVLRKTCNTYLNSID